MNETTTQLTILFIVLVACLVLVAAILSCVKAIFDRIQTHRLQSKDIAFGWQLTARIRDLDRWCCWHFPIVEDVCAYLLENQESIDAFRGRMKVKHGDREKTGRPPVAAPVQTLESRVAAWVRARIGPGHMHSRERAMRLLEEAVELAQAEGISVEKVRAQVAHVYHRPEGTPAQEAGGVAICLLGWCASTSTTFEAIAMAELARIESKPLSEIRGSLARKADADMITCLDDGGSSGGLA